MHLPETARQLAAGAASAAAFLALFFGLGLIWPVALCGGLAIFAATLLIVRRTPPPETVMIADGVSEADLSAALVAMGDAAGRLRALEASAPPAESGLFVAMAATLDRIRAHHARDPRDLRHTRRFLRHDLPRVVETAEAYVDLSARSGAAAADRLDRLADQIRSFAPALEKIDEACLENDFHKLEVEADVLSRQLARR